MSLQRIDMFVDGRSFGTNYIQWLVEDCENNYWYISSDTGRLHNSQKPQYSWKKAGPKKESQ